MYFATNGTETLRITSTGTLNFKGAGTAGSTQAVSFDGSAPINSLVIDSSGRLGIGTSSPGDKLDVYAGSLSVGSHYVATVNTDYKMRLRSVGAATNNNYLVEIGATGSGPQPADSDMTFATQTWNGSAYVTTEKARLTATGRLGIGTTSPGGKLVVSDGTTTFQFDPVGGTGNILRSLTSAGARDSLLFDASNIVFSNGATNYGRFDSSGRLLVGTTTDLSGGDADARLQVNGDTGAQILLSRQDFGALTAGTLIGEVVFRSQASGVQETSALIKCEADATQGSGDKPGRLVFSTTPNSGSSPTERMRISNYGRIDMRTDTGSFGGSGIPTLGLFQSGDTTLTQYFIYGAHSATGYSGTNCFAVLNNGNVINTNNSYGAISDIKLKENIIDASSQWADIKALQVRKYNFREETGQQTHTQIGLVAQEVELVSPGLVNESPDRDAEGNDLGTVTKGVNYSVLYMKAVKALQEAMERIETLETSNADMLARVTALEAA